MFCNGGFDIFLNLKRTGLAKGLLYPWYQSLHEQTSSLVPLKERPLSGEPGAESFSVPSWVTDLVPISIVSLWCRCPLIPKLLTKNLLPKC